MRGRLAGGGGLTAACGKPEHLGRGVPPSYRRGCLAQGLGEGVTSQFLYCLLAPPVDIFATRCGPRRSGGRGATSSSRRARAASSSRRARAARRADLRSGVVGGVAAASCAAAAASGAAFGAATTPWRRWAAARMMSPIWRWGSADGGGVGGPGVSTDGVIWYTEVSPDEGSGDAGGSSKRTKLSSPSSTGIGSPGSLAKAQPS